MKALVSRHVASSQSQPGNLLTGWSTVWRKLANVVRMISLRRRAQTLRVQESLSVGERRSLVVVQWENRRYLLGITPQAFQILDTDSNSDDLPRTTREKAE